MWHHTKDVVSFIAGLALMAHQALLAAEADLKLVLGALAMMGVPAGSAGLRLLIELLTKTK